MKRWLFFVYGVGCHLLFLGVYGYMAAFAGNFLVPKTIDSHPSVSTNYAMIWNIGLLLAFGFSHSIMARPRFKKVWTKIIPHVLERSTYVLVSCLMMILLMWQWKGMDTVLFEIQNENIKIAIWVLFAFGWLLVPTVSLMINHFDLFGTRQVWLYLKGKEYEPLAFRVPYLYKYVRHPLYIGWFLATWTTPIMTTGHLLFAGILTIYMGIAATIEEKDLVTYFGKKYTDYQVGVPMFIPSLSTSETGVEDHN